RSRVVARTLRHGPLRAGHDRRAARARASAGRHPRGADLMVRRRRARARPLPVPLEDRSGAARRGGGADRARCDPGDRRALRGGAALNARALGRATLARQMLLERSKTDVADAIGRLGALQAQEARPPFVALWSRVEGFEPSQLIDAFAAKTVVRG